MLVAMTVSYVLYQAYGTESVGDEVRMGGGRQEAHHRIWSVSQTIGIL